MQKKKVYGLVQRGKIAWNDLVALGKAVSYFEGNEIEVTLAKKVKHRTSPQNAYFHAAHLPIIHEALVNDCGWDNWTIENTKAFLKDMFLRVELLDKDGNKSGKFITRGTSD